MAPAATTNRSLLIPYALPYVAYTGIASLPEHWLGAGANYGLRIVATGVALAWGWRSFRSLRGPGSVPGSLGVGVLAGLAGVALWIAMFQSLVGEGGEPWGDWAFALRTLASATIVPVFEELLMRGYVLGFATQWDLARQAGDADPFGTALDHCSVNETPPGAATPLAVAISTGAFMLGHSFLEWPAALAFGFLMCGLWIARKDLLSCVSAHAVANLALALYIRATGTWSLW